MKNIHIIILFFICGSIQASPLTSQLEEKIRNTPSQEYIRIYIALTDVYDFLSMEEALTELNKIERHEYVKQELKSFHLESQENIMSQINELKEEGLITKVKHLWITNVIICESTGEAIYELAKREDIRKIDHDEYRIVLPDIDENQSHFNDNQTREITWNVLIVNAEDVWAEGYTGQGSVVSVIDTGVNYNHQDLNDHMWGGGIFFPLHGYDFHNDDNNPMDDMGHGTHCAGTVAGDGTAGSQTGIAPDAAIMALKVLDASGGGYESSCWEAIEFSVDNDADVMSLSLGWLHAWGPDRTSWRNAMNSALFAGVIASVAAGNEGTQYGVPDNVRTPGDVPPPWLHPDQTLTGGLSSVVSVGATNSNDGIASFSSRGPVSWDTISPFLDYPYNPEMGLIRPDVSAPGENIKSLAHYSNTGYESGWSGTSMATPCVAGVMALMISKDPSITPTQMSEIIETSSLHLGSTGKNNTYGSGRVDAYDAVNMVWGDPIPPNPATNPIPQDGQISISLDSDLRWSNGGGATSFLLFFGTDNPPTNILYGEWLESPIYVPIELNYETEYFWQITSMNQYGETEGDIWSFTTTGPPDETYETGDFSQFPWQFQGYEISWPNDEPIENYIVIEEIENINWIVTNEDNNSGLYSAKSGPIDHNQASTMSITGDVLNDDYIGFNYRVTSEYSTSGNYFYDGLMFFIDDEVMGWFQPTPTGDTPWNFVSYSVPQGEHTFTWAYVKDSGPGGTDMPEDCAWIDDIYFPTMDDVTGNVTVEVMADWNILGLPVLTDDTFYGSLFPDAIENTLYYFSPTGYLPATELTPGVGYWLRISEENTVEIQGQLIQDLTLTLHENWNLITGISTDVSVTSIGDPQSLIIPNTIYAYGSSGYYGANSILPGKGYWLRSSGEGEITLSSNLRSQNPKVITDHLSCNSITINGNTLYFGGNISEDNLLSYSLPPLPPEGSFDVRFSDHMKYSENGGSISLRGFNNSVSIEYFLIGQNENWILSLSSGKTITLSGEGSFFINKNINEIILKKQSALPHTFTLLKSFPNPFNPVTTITYTIPEDSYIELSVFSVQGKLIQHLENSFKFTGNYAVLWDGKDMIGKSVGSGIYIVKLSTDKEFLSHKVLLLK